MNHDIIHVSQPSSLVVETWTYSKEISPLKTNPKQVTKRGVQEYYQAFLKMTWLFVSISMVSWDRDP